MAIITLTTDFGARDWFAGVMKGAILRLAPQTRIVDITHEVPPGNVRAGAFALAASYDFFPRDTIHVAVVDPGVGSSRRALAVETANFIFVGPDNGLLSWAVAKEKVTRVYSLNNPRSLLAQLSATFHGRDLFAPVAAHLSRGVPLRKMGAPAKDFIQLPWPEPKRTPNGVLGEVLYIDQFGNGITNIAAALLDERKDKLEVFLRRKRICPVAGYYQAVPPGRPLALVGSTDLLEIAINGGNAAKHLKLAVGLKVEVRRMGL